MCGSPLTNEEKVAQFLECVVRYADPQMHTYRLRVLVDVCVRSVLKVGGVFILVTYGDPEHRIPALFPLSHRWSIDADRLRASSVLWPVCVALARRSRY